MIESSWTTVQTRTTSGKIHNWVLEKETGDLYLYSGHEYKDDWVGNLVIKSAFIAAATPIYCAGLMTINALVAIYRIVRLENPIPALYQIVRSPLYATALIIAALGGWIFPMQGRKWIGQVELKWHQVDSYKDAISHCCLDKFPYIDREEFCKGVEEGKTCFLALCMQKRKNINQLKDESLI